MITLTMEQFEELNADHGGLCLKCGEEAYQIEPDAAKCECEFCGARAVYGAENLLLMGRVV